MRLRIDLAYDGSGFHGWAQQSGLRTVQGDLEQAIDTVLRTTGSSLTVAGRTDAGVHARGQVAHVDLEHDLVAAAAGRSHEPDDSTPLRRRLNGVIGPDVRIHRISEAPAGFDARFSAVWRRYAYRVADQPQTRGPADARSRAQPGRDPLDLDAMNAAAQRLLGRARLRGVLPEAARAPPPSEPSWTCTGTATPTGIAVATVRADAFCHTMVRSLVGALIAVGEGRQEPAWPAEVLTRGQRDPAVKVSRAHGLTLEEVAYPPDGELRPRARSRGRCGHSPRASATDPHQPAASTS